MKRRSSSFAPRLRSALLVAAWWLAVTPCWAQSERPALELAWSAPGDCPQQARARELVAEYLGERELSAAEPGQRVLTAHATIRRRAERWELSLVTTLDGQPGQRALSAMTCADVAAAAALVLAFAIDPGAALRHAAPAPPPARAVPAAPPAPPAAASRTRFGVAGSVHGAWGALPGTSGGAALELSLAHGAWGAKLAGYVFAERAAPAAERPSAGGEFSLWALAAAPCWSPSSGALRLRACLPIELQRLTAEGYGVDEPAEATASELLLGVELAPAISLSSRLELVAPLGVGVSLRRPEFYLERIGNVFRASLVQGRAGLGLLARF